MLVAVAIAAVAIVMQTRGGESRSIPWSDLTRELDPTRWPRQTISVIRSQEKLEALLRSAALQPAPRAPDVDFSRRTAVLIAVGPRSSTGYRLRIRRVVERKGRIEVFARETTPGPGRRVRAVLTFPYRLITVPAGRTVRVHIEGCP